MFFCKEENILQELASLIGLSPRAYALGLNVD